LYNTLAAYAAPLGVQVAPHDLLEQIQLTLGRATT
jgi:hypothetical protein